MSSFSRYELTGDPAALDEAIGAARAAVRAVTRGKDPGPLVDNLAHMLGDRSGLDGVTEEIVAAHRDVVDATATATDDPRWETRLLRLQTVIMGWFTHGHRYAEVAAAVAVLRRAAEVRIRGVDRPHHLSALAAILQIAHHSGGAADEVLDEAIDVGRRAVAVLPRGHVRDIGTRKLLGSALMTRFRIGADPADRTEALATFDDAVARAGADSSEGRDVADTLEAELYRGRAGSSDRDQVDRLRVIVRNLPAGHSQRAERLADLGLALRAQFQERGDPVLIDEAIEIGLESVKAGRPGCHGRARHLSNLGAAYGDRALASGGLTDLDRGIEMLDDAVNEAGRDRDLRATCLSNLGALLCQRYQRTGASSALQEGITALRRAVADTDPGDPRRELFLFNLNQALHPPAR